MDSAQSGDGTAIGDAFERRAVTIDSGAYERTMESVLADFRAAVGSEFVEEIDVEDCRDYATELHRAVNDGELAASTARKNYRTLRAFLSWCVDDRIIDRNPAEPDRASSPLPSSGSNGDTQYWSPEDREAFLRYVDRRNDRAQDGKTDVDPYTAQRDQVLAYVIALTGVRGAEILRSADDDDRNGLRWRDVGENVFAVFGKVREYQEIGYTGPEKDRLERWKRRLDPASADWPVFPTLAPRTLHRADYGVGDELEATDYDRDDDRHPIEACSEYGITPPALSLQAARKTVKRLSRAAGLPKDGDDEYLKLHGARRGLGGELYDVDPVEAQRTLRHQSIETTFESYSEKRAAESGQRRAEILDANDET